VRGREVVLENERELAIADRQPSVLGDGLDSREQTVGGLQPAMKPAAGDHAAPHTVAGHVRTCMASF
jgi:hypothetical protein